MYEMLTVEITIMKHLNTNQVYLIEEKAGVKVGQGKLLVRGKFSHQCIKLITFPRINLGLS